MCVSRNLSIFAPCSSFTSVVLILMSLLFFLVDLAEGFVIVIVTVIVICMQSPCVSQSSFRLSILPLLPAQPVYRQALLCPHLLCSL